MLISLLVLSPEQIIIPIWVSHGSLHRGPITLLEQLVVLIGRHNDMMLRILWENLNREGERVGLRQEGRRRIGLENGELGGRIGH